MNCEWCVLVLNLKRYAILPYTYRIPNETQIRPTPDQLDAKCTSTLELGQAWRSMKDFIMHSVFDVPICIDDSNKLCAVDTKDKPINECIRFCPNHYPYNIQGGGRHFVLWFGCHDEPNINVNKVVGRELTKHLGHDNFDYAWYCNPKMSIPDFYHVQVFWVLLESS